MAESLAPSTSVPAQAGPSPQQTRTIMSALSTALQSSTGEKVEPGTIALLLEKNMDQLNELAKQGRLSTGQINEVSDLTKCRNL